jgi:hypothetical protein
MHNREFLARVSYEKRVKQRHFLYRLGVIAVALGVLLFALAFADMFLAITNRQALSLLPLAVFTISFGTVLGVVFGRVGWAQSKIVDVLLNQLSILMMLAGYTAGFLTIISGDMRSFLGAIFMLTLGIVLAAVGIRYHSPVPMHR